MPTYMTQFAYTADAWRKLAHNPEDRSVPIRGLVEELGGRLLGLYYMWGEYDGFILYELPDARTATVAAITAALAGHLRAVRTTHLFTVTEGMEIMGKAGKLAYAAPKG